MRNSAVKIHNITFSYPSSKREVFRDLTFEIEENQWVLILGKNGCGKSTLLKIILGYLKPQTGRVWLYGREIHKIPSRERAKLLGYLAQTDIPPFPISVKEFFKMGLYPKWDTLKDSHLFEILNETIKKFELEFDWDFLERKITELSGGELRWVYFIRILLQNPKVLLLDEPILNLDPIFKAKFWQILKSLKHFGHTGFVTLQELTFPEKFFDRYIGIKSSTVFIDGNNSFLRENPNLLIELYDTPLELIFNEYVIALPLLSFKN